jgi:S1-C subfamily serine protease
MRRIIYAALALTLAALACNVPVEETATAPAPLPVPVEPAAQTETGGEIEGIEVAPTPSGPRPQELSFEQIEAISQAAVQIIAAEPRGGRLEAMWGGSGTIVSPNGLIVTNCHVACGAPVLVILMTTSPDNPPEERYLAEVQSYDEVIDLALVQVVSDVDGNPVDPASLDLPYLPIGDSDSLHLGDPVRIFGYPGAGGETITFTSGAVSGFEMATISGVQERLIIKTDAQISSGNSGGTAVDLYGNLVAIPTEVNPDVREGATLGAIGILRPINLVNYLTGGTPPELADAERPPATDPDPNEPNDARSQATGPLQPGDSVQAYISWLEDVDLYVIDITTASPIEVELGVPSGVDYDVYLLDDVEVLDRSENEVGDERIEYNPYSPGRYWVAVVTYAGANLSQPYTLTVSFDGGVAGAASVSVRGQAVHANTDRPVTDGVFGILRADATCAQFQRGTVFDLSMVVVRAQTDSQGVFELVGVPTGATYPAFFASGSNVICNDGWLNVPSNSGDIDLGTLRLLLE